MRLSKFLLVEDNQEAANIIIGMLQYAGHKVVHAATAKESLETIKAERFDGILLDCKLPDMDGLQLCRMMRTYLKDEPIILTTIQANNEDELMAAGVTAFVPKPLSQNLLPVIDKHVTTRSMTQHEKQEAGKLGARLRRWFNAIFASDYHPYD